MRFFQIIFIFLYSTSVAQRKLLEKNRDSRLLIAVFALVLRLFWQLLRE